MNRNLSNKINYVLDSWLPPVIRDNRILMAIMLRVVVGKKYRYYMQFKDRLPSITEKEINKYYSLLADTFIQRNTDLNTACIQRILSEAEGPMILDAAAGKGYMAGRLYAYDNSLQITVSDIILPGGGYRLDGINYVSASLTEMPFNNDTFDTVICTHALEHIKDVKTALKELRRICRRKLIIVVPRQREYRYTFDLHINFYPYRYNVEALLGSNTAIELLDNDWLCIEYMK